MHLNKIQISKINYETLSICIFQSYTVIERISQINKLVATPFRQRNTSYKNNILRKSYELYMDFRDDL